MRDRVRHVLSLSGGKDSTALAIYLRDRIPNPEYVFCDTEKELPETYEYLDRVEAYLGQPIVRLKDGGRGFDHWLAVYSGYLPSTRMRWCTRHLKIRPFEHFVGDTEVVNYIGIRADEERSGYLSSKTNIRARYPFKEDGITKSQVLQILGNSGLGLPLYYRWRSRSGCFFCFFQQKIEWVGLFENHRDLYLEAAKYEKYASDGTRYTWNVDESLQELCRHDRVLAIKAERERRLAFEKTRTPKNRPLIELAVGENDLGFWLDDDELDGACEICR